MYGNIKEHLAMELEKINDAGLFKAERIISSSQQAEIELESGEKVLNFCANNYLGLSNHPELVQAAKNALDTHGFGMSSVRFICGTQDLHKTLEQKIASFFGTEDLPTLTCSFHSPNSLAPNLSCWVYSLFHPNSIEPHCGLANSFFAK